MSGSVSGDPTLAVVTSSSPSIYGTAVTFTATVSSGPTGTVTFYDGGASIGTGTINGTTATLTTSSLLAGSHTITASWAGNSNYDAATSGAISQVVNQATPAVTWATPAAIAYGTALSSTQLDASSTIPGTFVYSPAAGTVPAVGLQTLSVTFMPTDTTDYTTAKASVTLTVNGSATTPAITWAAPAAIAYGTELTSTQLDATSPVAGTFAYTPAAGTLLKAGAQTLSVTFTPTDTVDYAKATATVTLTVNQATPAITWAAPAAITYGTALSATQLDATSTVPGTFVYSPAAGAVLAAGSHTLSAKFTPTDTTDYKVAAATVTLTVNSAATETITWADPAAITYGTALSSTQLDASSSVAGTFAYTPATGTVLKAGSQTLSVTFTPTDTTDYKVETATVTLTVNQATPAITWATPATIIYGTALSSTQLDASSTVAGTFAYTPAAGTVTKAGFQSLSVTFTPTDATDYKVATAAVILTVNQATPAITWAVPAAITYGTALSTTQLDASSTVAGKFVYSPAIGTVLAAGSPTLSVTFTPTDTTDYTTATATVTLTVNAATYVLTINPTSSVPFGSVTLNTTSTQQVTLTNTGTGSVTVSSATVITLTGTGFSLASPFSATTLTTGQQATLNVQFDPTTAVAATGTLTVVSSALTNGSTVIPLSGTGTASSYSVDLSWDAPASSTDPVAGYNIYRAPSGSSTFQLLGASVGAETTYVDGTVMAGQTYDYEVASVDSSGIQSVPAGPVPVTIP